MKRIRAFLCTGLLVFACACLQGQIQRGNALFEHLTFEDGLSSNAVNCLFQDSRGFIWIGTSSGLNRYDGVEIVQYFRSDNKNSIAGNYIYSIREDKHRNLWIGTNSGVSYFEPATNKFTNYLNSPAETERLKATQFNVGIDSDDNLWVTTNFHLSFFDRVQNKFIQYKIDNGESLPITRNYNVRSVFEDSRKRLWIPTSYGVKLFDRATKQMTSFHFPEKEKAALENFVVAIRETADKKIIAPSWGGGILIFNETKQRFDQFKFFEEPLIHRNLINIVLDVLPVQDKVYCATSEGLVVTDATGLAPGVCKNFTIYQHNDNNGKSISSNITNTLLIDRAGALWVVAKGISKIDPLKQQFQNSLLSGNKGPLQVSSISIVNNRLLLGAQDAYFFSGGQVTPLGITPKLKSDYGEQVWDVHAGKNYLWLATTNGLVQLTREGRFVKQYTYRKNDTASISGERLWKVYEDSRGLVWMGTVRRGISLLNPRDGSIKNYFAEPGSENSLFNCYISSFFEDGAGNIWFIAKGNMVYCFNRATGTFTVRQINFSNGVKLTGEPLIIRQRENGSLVIASRKGLLQFDPATQNTGVVAYHPDMHHTKQAIADKAGNYWIVTANGLLHFNTQTAAFKRYTTQNGLPVNEDIEAIQLLPDGNIVLGGLGFVSVFNPAVLGNNKNIPPVYITQILANSRDTLNAGEKNRLPHLSGIEFHFAALGFSNARQNLYKYRLVGIDKNWSPPTIQRSVSYAQLPPGTYTFEVMGSNADGLWNETPAVFHFSIRRPFYKAWWFYALLAAAAGGVVYFIYRYRLRKALELEKMRTRIATDLHDDIGATLSSISMYSDALKKQVRDTLPHLEPVLDKMGESSRDMVAGMSDIVWAINPGNDSGEKLAARMESYATDMCALKKIQLHFSCDDKLKQLALPLDIRKNLYLIFKEAVNNAVKYSGAENVWVSITAGTKLRLQVKDDGCGFDETAVRRGNGLKNFKLRAHEIKGSFTMQAAPDSGTSIIVSCNVS